MKRNQFQSLEAILARVSKLKEQFQQLDANLPDKIWMARLLSLMEETSPVWAQMRVDTLR